MMVCGGKQNGVFVRVGVKVEYGSYIIDFDGETKLKSETIFNRDVHVGNSLRM